MALTFPLFFPASTKSPILSVPACTNIVEIYPLPLSKNASTTVPLAYLSGFAFSSNNSASKRTFSSNSFTPSPFKADIS